MKHCIKILSIAIVLLWCSSGIAADSTRILIIHSYSQDYPWTKGQHNGFVDSLKKFSPIIKTEYLDTKRVAFESSYSEYYAQFIEKKYKGFQPHAIYITDDNALKFGLTHVHRLFSDAPLFFSGVNDYSQIQNLNQKKATGVFEKKEIQPNLDLFPSLFSYQPDTKIKLLIIGDDSKTDHFIKNIIKSEINKNNNLSADYISNNRLDAILNGLQKSDASIILLTTVGSIKDEKGQSLTLEKIITSIAQSDEKIVMCMEDGYLFEGVLGGYVTSSYSQGKSAALLLDSYLQGSPIASLSPITKSPNEYIFNDKVLEALDISLTDRIAKISKTINPRLSFYQRFEKIIQVIMVILSLALVTLSLLYFLVISRKNKQLAQANKTITEQANNLEIQVFERTNELEKSNNNLELANKAKSEFLANMSHELRTPMHGILSYAGMGQKRVEKSTPEKNLKYFTNIKVSGDRLLTLLNDLLDLAKLESGKMEIYCTQNSLKQIVINCVAEQQARLMELNQKIVYMPGNITGEGEFDAVRIGQVITNFISNAIKFNPEGQKIEFTISSTDLAIHSRDENKDNRTIPGLLFSVRDYGKGISTQDLVLVFDKFKQGFEAEAGTTKGTGLGLAICREIIVLHRGQIWAENHSQGGAVFSFIIPVE